MSAECAVGFYRARRPQETPLYRLVEAFYDQVKGDWEERFERRYGYWRSFVDDVVHAYLDCGRFESGFARVRCSDCGDEYLVATSCQMRGFCPSCGAKRAAAFAAFLTDEVLEEVGHAMWTFSLPKMIRPYFMHHPELRGRLCRAAYETVQGMMSAAALGCEGFRTIIGDSAHLPTRITASANPKAPWSNMASPFLLRYHQPQSPTGGVVLCLGETFCAGRMLGRGEKEITIPIPAVTGICARASGFPGSRVTGHGDHKRLTRETRCLPPKAPKRHDRRQLTVPSTISDNASNERPHIHGTGASASRSFLISISDPRCSGGEQRNRRRPSDLDSPR